MTHMARRFILSGRIRRGTAWALLCVAMLCGSLAAGHIAAVADDRPAGCRVLAPESWQGVRIEWIGPCRGGLAHGLGVAIARADGRAQEAFFGDVVAGRMVEGVFDVPGGYRPARFNDGVPVPLDDRNQIINVFRVAANAASAVSNHYRAARDMKAARGYAEAAERLANQMD